MVQHRAWQFQPWLENTSSRPGARFRQPRAISALSLAFSTVSSLEVTLPVFGQVIVFAILTEAVGIPHGGLDHRFGSAVCRPLAGKWWPLAFYSAYIAVGLMVIAGWVIAPLSTIAIFFILSSIHFGESGSFAMAAFEGGMVIWIPFLARSREASSLLSLVAPGQISGSIQNIVCEMRPFLWLLLIVLAVRVSRLVWVGISDREPQTILKATRLIAFGVMFATAPVLISFATFFCGWHSTRELFDLSKRMDPSRPFRGLLRVLRESAPLSLLLIGVISFAAYWRVSNGHPFEAVVIQGVFLGLSAVAVPHILLHAIADRLIVDPFAAEAGS